MRIASLLLGALVLASAARAQILAVPLRDEKAAKKFKRFVRLFEGRPVVCGEAKSGFLIRKRDGAVAVASDAKAVELYVSDPGDPAKVPYRIRGGERVPRSRSGVLKVDRKYLLTPATDIGYLMRDQTIMGLAAEYDLRLEGIEETKRLRDDHETTSQAWFNMQRRVLTAYDKLHRWLISTTFAKAAEKLERVIATQRKFLTEDAVALRTAKAMRSPRKIPLPEDLVEVNGELTGGRLEFKAYQSQHIRILTGPPVRSDAEYLDLLKLGETIIEGFRREFVDPYTGEDFTDYSLDHVFAEFFFIKGDDLRLYEKFMTDLYLGRWDPENKERQLRMGGSMRRGLRGQEYNHYNKVDPKDDLEGRIAHGLGHDLVNIHFGRNRGGGSGQDWLSEGVGYYLSYEYLGRNSVTCKQFARARYDRTPGKEGMKTVQMGQRASFNGLALKSGPPLSQLMVTRLHEMDDAHLAKAWSFFDYLARKEGRAAVLWLRQACDRALRPGFANQLREDSVEIWGLEQGQDVYSILDERWRKFARSGQKKDGSTRKRRR